MISQEVYNLILGLTTEAIDVEALFAADVAGKTGLYPGQLVAELAEARPALLPRLVDCVCRAMLADDARTRTAALHGALRLPRDTPLAAALHRLATRHGDAVSCPEFIELVARQPAEAAAPWIDVIAGLSLDGAAAEAQARLRAAHRPEALQQSWLAAVAGPVDDAVRARLAAQVRALGSSAVDALTDALAPTEVETRRRASAVLFVAYDAARAPFGYDRWMQLHQRLRLATDRVPPRPLESHDEAERREALAARLAARVARRDKPGR